MADEDGNAELTLAIVKNNTFVAAVERLFLGQAGDDPLELSDSGNNAQEIFDPIVARKK